MTNKIFLFSLALTVILLSPLHSNSDKWVLITNTKNKDISTTGNIADRDSYQVTLHNLTFITFNILEIWGRYCPAYDDKIGIQFNSQRLNKYYFCRVVPHVHYYGQHKEFQKKVTSLKQSNANPNNFKFTVEIWHTFTYHRGNSCSADYIYKYWIYKRSEPSVKTIGTFLAKFNSVQNYSDKTIKLTNTIYISGSREAYNQAKYLESDYEPEFIGISTDSFPSMYTKPIDLSLKFYNEFTEKFPIACNIVLQKVIINDKFTNYQQRFIGGYSLTQLKHTILYNGAIIPNWNQNTISLMFNRIDQSKDNTPPLDKNDVLISDNGIEPGITFQMYKNNNFSQLKELYEENEPNSILNAYVFESKWWKKDNLFYLEITSKPTTKPDQQYVVSLVISLVMILFLILALLSLTWIYPIWRN